MPRWGLACLLILAGACSGERTAPRRERAPTPRAETEEKLPSAQLLKVVPWPGGGLQLTFWRSDDESRGRLIREDGSSSELQLEPVSEPAGMTALVIAPSPNAIVHTARLEAARAFVDALPDAERIGVWLGTESLPLVAELTKQREHIHARIASIPPASEASGDASDAMRRLMTRLMYVSAPFGPNARSWVNVGLPPLAAADAPSLASGQVGWTQFTLDGKASSDSLSNAVAHHRAGIVRLGVCGEFRPYERLVLEIGDARVKFDAPLPLAEFGPQACDANAAARDDYPLGDIITFELTPEELEQHDLHEAQKDEGEFTLSMRIGDAMPVAARAHFRGQTSLDCERKSYSVHFADDVPRRVTKHTTSSEFYLLSMCQDPGAFQQMLANRIMVGLGLFPLAHRYVRLRVAGRNRGVYMFLDKPDESLKQSQAMLSSVLRRRNDPRGIRAQVKFPKPDKDAAAATEALARYEALLEPLELGEVDQLYERLSEHLDLDSYLRWLAFQSVFQCGDYVDETFFYASDEVPSGPYFRNLGWDADDLFKKCHHGGERAHPDPHELLYCAEGNIDRALLVSPPLYRRYAETLAALIESDLDPDRVAAELAEVRSELSSHLTDDRDCAGTAGALSGELATCERVRQELDVLTSAFEAKLRARVQLLRERLALYGVQ